jgi:pyruvate/2-oxoglutarate dehydrogenase complex dihydrolipoamide dehydrogenase (E3) component
VTPGAGEVVRELAGAINADDVQGLARLLDPEVVQYGTRGGVDQGRVIRGREAVLATGTRSVRPGSGRRSSPSR